MFFRTSSLIVACVVMSGAARAQMPNMPGMSMPSSPQPQTQSHAQHPHGGATPAQGSKDVPADLAHPDATANSQDATRSMQQSAAQQMGQAQVTPPPGADAASLMRDAFAVQENEAPELRTGSSPSRPLPDLLAGVRARKPVALDELLKLAAAHNPTLAEARAVAARSRGEARQAGLMPDPSIGYSGEHIRGGEYGGGEQGGYISQRFVLGGKLGLRRDALEAQARADDAAAEEQAARVRSDVTCTFYRTLVAQAEIAVEQRLLRTARDAAETAHQLANIGQADAPDVLNAELEAEQAGIDVVRAERTFLGAFQALVAEAGVPDMAVAPLSGDVEAAPALDADAQIAGILAQSPQIGTAQAEIAGAQAQIKAAKRESVPDLTVRAGEWYSGERIESSGKPAGLMSFADAGVTLPLWNRNQGGTDAANAELARAEAELRRTQLGIRRNAAPLVQEYAAAQFEVERYREEMLPRARRAYELYVMKYQQMAAPYPQVLVAQRMLFQLQGTYLRALQSEWESATRLQNFTLSGGLNSPQMSGVKAMSVAGDE